MSKMNRSVRTLTIGGAAAAALTLFAAAPASAETEVAELKPSRSRPNAGIVTFMHQLINQRDEIVCQCLRSALLLRTPA